MEVRRGMGDEKWKEQDYVSLFGGADLGFVDAGPIEPRKSPLPKAHNFYSRLTK